MDIVKQIEEISKQMKRLEGDEDVWWYLTRALDFLDMAKEEAINHKTRPVTKDS